MKLIACRHCGDVKALLFPKQLVKCHCGNAGGWLTSRTTGEYWGDAIPVGINTSSMATAVRGAPTADIGVRFEAFVIPPVSPTFTRRKAKPVVA